MHQQFRGRRSASSSKARIFGVRSYYDGWDSRVATEATTAPTEVKQSPSSPAEASHG
jgi:hypothetical protein